MRLLGSAFDADRRRYPGVGHQHWHVHRRPLHRRWGNGHRSICCPDSRGRDDSGEVPRFRSGHVLCLLGSGNLARGRRVLRGTSERGIRRNESTANGPLPWQTQNLDSTYAWRIPSYLQGAPAIACFLILQFVPESPRWLISHDRHEEARDILGILHSGEHEQVQVQYREIVDTIAFEKENNVSMLQALSKKSNRKRLLLTCTFSAITMLPGTNIITFYFGDMLQGAGIESPTTQLEINVILASWSLVVAVISSWYADWLGRRWLCFISLALQTALIFIFGGLTKVYGESSDTSGIYGTIAVIFLYNTAYNWGITPLTVLYPPEILSYEIRSVGMGIYTFATKSCGLVAAMAIPFGLQAIAWKFYMVNGCFDVLMLVFVYATWVETRGLTLEEVDNLFDKEKRTIVAEQVKEETKVGTHHATSEKQTC